MSPLFLLAMTSGQKPELSEQMGLFQFTLTRRFNSSLNMSPGQKLHDGGSKSKFKKHKIEEYLYMSCMTNLSKNNINILLTDKNRRPRYSIILSI